MLDFLIDHPYILIFIFYGLISVLSAKKKVAQQKHLKQQAQAGGRARSPVGVQPAQPQLAGSQPARPQPRQEQFRSKIEEALRNAMKEADQEFVQANSAAAAVRDERVAQAQIAAGGAPAVS